MKMKNILFYSPDLSFCASVLMYFEKKYAVTTTNDFHQIEVFLKNSEFDMLILDSQPNEKIEQLICNIRPIPIIMTYVFTRNILTLESQIRSHVNAILYKPFDFEEMSGKIDILMAN
ncbi:MAG: hypothetical protein HBSAPP04_21680 [Ignavibacteriaceae bacterium]|nr:MAG: hypothetical protein EDM75_01360 [Chlorobiota bacterium]GJQ33329.1 MAG: hypothetical protein HBSAPP04_21680 [Ignavibacteriaceae bacterium]